MRLFGPSKKEKLLQEQNDVLQNQNEELQKEIERLTGLIPTEQKQLLEIKDELSQKEEKVKSLDQVISDLIVQKASLNSDIVLKQKQISIYDQEIEMQEYGLYQPTFVFANSDLYKERLKELREEQKKYIRGDIATYCGVDWTVNGSRSQGKTMERNAKKVLLRSFNAECDDIVSNVKISNLEKSIERIYKASEQISRLGKYIAEICITQSYVDLKIKEVKLALDFQQKKQEERELKKELLARKREEAKVQKEIEEEIKRLKKEQAHYKNALSEVIEQIEKHGENSDLLEKKRTLENQLEEILVAIEDVDYRAANQKAGYVYIISNIGAFGENVYKIGMTRRLEPRDRVDELSIASVPFKFDIHALIFSEDAPALEAALHNAFESRKMNKINPRKEFFAVTLDEIKAEVRKNFDRTVEWTDVPEAEQYRQSLLLSK